MYLEEKNSSGEQNKKIFEEKLEGILKRYCDHCGTTLSYRLKMSIDSHMNYESLSKKRRFSCRRPTCRKLSIFTEPFSERWYLSESHMDELIGMKKSFFQDPDLHIPGLEDTEMWSRSLQANRHTYSNLCFPADLIQQKACAALRAQCALSGIS